MGVFDQISGLVNVSRCANLDIHVHHFHHFRGCKHLCPNHLLLNVRVMCISVFYGEYLETKLGSCFKGARSGPLCLVHVGVIVPDLKLSRWEDMAGANAKLVISNDFNI